MKKLVWRLALFVIAAAAGSTTGWSLYAVARHFGTPSPIAAAAVAVFDGVALACLKLASDASRAGRTAIGARLATVLMAGVSVYLNNWHSELIRGGLAASLLYAVPTVALILVADLSWAAERAAARSERGETPMRMPVLGLTWLIAPKGSVNAVKKRAQDHLHALDGTPARRSAHDVLTDQFAGMDPADAIRIVAASHPQLAPGELAELLRVYGITVDAVHVALTLGRARPQVRIDRADADAPDPHHDADQFSGPPVGPAAINRTAAILDAASDLGAGASPADIAGLVAERHRLDVKPNYVRTVLSRDARRPRRHGGNGGYA
jgi:hypothetical protein